MRHWLRGGREDQSERLADLMKFGIAEGEAKAWLATQEDPDEVAVFGVWAENAEGLAVFLRLKRQWRLHPFSGKPVGLDNCRVESTFRLMRIPARRWPSLLDQMDICQDVVLGVRCSN